LTSNTDSACLQRKRLMDKAASHGHAAARLVLGDADSRHPFANVVWDLDVFVIDELPPERTPSSRA